MACTLGHEWSNMPSWTHFRSSGGPTKSNRTVCMPLKWSKPKSLKFMNSGSEWMLNRSAKIKQLFLPSGFPLVVVWPFGSRLASTGLMCCPPCAMQEDETGCPRLQNTQGLDHFPTILWGWGKLCESESISCAEVPHLLMPKKPAGWKVWQ